MPRTASCTEPSSVVAESAPATWRVQVRAPGRRVAVGVHRDDRVGPDRLLQLLGRAERQDLAPIHDPDAIAQLVGLLHVVRRQHDGLAAGVQARDDLPQADPALRVEAGRRLVEEQDGGVVQQRAGDHQPLREAARERHHGRLCPFGQVEPHEQVVGGGARGGGPHSEEAAVEVQVLPHGQRAVEGVRLGHDADQLLGDRRVAHDVDAADERLAGRRDHAGREHARGRRLAGAVGSEQAEDLTLADGQVEPVHRRDAARVDLRQVDRPDDVGPRGSRHGLLRHEAARYRGPGGRRAPPAPTRPAAALAQPRY